MTGAFMSATFSTISSTILHIVCKPTYSLCESLIIIFPDWSNAKVNAKKRKEMLR